MDSADGITDNETTRKESMCINQSLTYLEQCVVALARRGNNHIPYRQSKLTTILKDCLGANCNTLMIACIWGESSHLEETVSTLRLASRMMRVQNETTKIETVDSSALIKKQAKIIKALKQELLMHDALVERTGVEYEPYTPEQQKSIDQMIERYIEASEADEEETLAINSYRQMLEICKLFKKKLLNSKLETLAAHEEAAAMYGSGGGRPISSADFRGIDAIENKLLGDFDPQAPLVGETDARSRLGFSLGNATSDSKPAGGIEGISKFMQKAPGSNSVNQKPLNSPGKKQVHNTTFDLSPDSKHRGADDGLLDHGSNALFETYISSDGIQLYNDFLAGKVLCKELRQKVKHLTFLVNEAKSEIDRLQSDVDARKASRIELLRRSGLKASETEDIVDEEEFRLMKELREEKRKYKNAYEQMQKNKSNNSQAQNASEDLKSKLSNGFAVWSSQHASGGCQNQFNDSYDRDADQLDDQEAFDKLEMERLLANDPDSFAFFNAQKTRRAHMTQHGGSIKQIQKNKRFR